MLYTTYLAKLTQIRRVNGQLRNTTEALEDIGLEDPIVYYVMRNRGNNEVAPNKELLENFKKMEKVYELEEIWPQYVDNYLFQIGLSAKARRWMEKIAKESLTRDVVLVCYEKDWIHCHRRLLAQEIERRHTEADYQGELL